MNVTALATRERQHGGALAMWDAEQITVIKDLICPGASDSELALFGQVCQKTGLDPFSKQIYGIMRWDGRKKREVLSIQTSIDGFRLTAQRSGEYAGQAGPEWCGPDGKWRDVWLENYAPSAARVGVYRKGWSQPTWAVATWQEYVQTNKDGQPTGMWRNMPANQLAKCAESLALRKVFPAEMSSLYTRDEMGQADNQQIIESGDDLPPVDWNAAWHVAVKGTRFADDETRHKFISYHTQGKHDSLTGFLAVATRDEASGLLRAIEQRIAAEARKAAKDAESAQPLKSVTPERADLNLQLRAAIAEANDLGGDWEVPQNLDDLSDEDVQGTLKAVVDAIEGARSVPA